MDSLADIRRQRAERWKTDRKGIPEDTASASRVRSRSPRHMDICVDLDSPVGSSPGPLRVMSWNIDGLDNNSNEEDMLGRTLWVTKEINESRPHVVFLQELIEFNFQIISQYLSGAFYIFKQQECNQPYFVAILVHKATMSIHHPGVTIPFPSSKMGRGGVIVAASLKSSNVKIGFVTAHLESLRESSSERIRQFGICTDAADSAISSGAVDVCVFGGDLNIRDNEVPTAFRSRDCWTLAGKPKNHEFTWDLTLNDNARMPNGAKPKCRFDRIYVIGSKLSVEEFKLVGTERVQGLDRFASDHFGILASFISQ